MKNAGKQTIVLILAMAMCPGLLSANMWAAGPEPYSARSAPPCSLTMDLPICQYVSTMAKLVVW